MAEPDPALKGRYNGNCNRAACQKPGATWYNRSTLAYYCPACARTINNVSSIEDVRRLFGIDGVLCTPPNPVQQAVEKLLAQKAVHRSGAVISEMTRTQVFEHTQGELQELFGAESKADVCDELGDVLGCLMHLAVLSEIPWVHVEQACLNKFKQRFTPGDVS